MAAKRRRPARLSPFYGWFVGRGLDPSLQLGGYVRLHGRIWNPPLRETINFAITQGCTGRRGEQCSPVRYGGNVRFSGRAMLAPTVYIWFRLPLRGAPPLGGEGWLGCNPWHEGHPSVTCGDSSPQGEPHSTPTEFILAPQGRRDWSVYGHVGLYP